MVVAASASFDLEITMAVGGDGPAFAPQWYPGRDRAVPPDINHEVCDMGKRDGEQKGAQTHAEGQHGEKTHSAFIEGLHGQHGGSEESEGVPQAENDTDAHGRPIAGHHRLHEDRQQHDEAEKNSEANRLRR